MGKSSKGAIDRADWHYGGNFPEGLPQEAGGTHIGLFVAWVIHRGLESEELREQSADALALVRERRMTGREFLFQELDEKFWPGELNDEGNAFVDDYYRANTYYSDYAEALAEEVETLYHVEDSWANFDRLAPVLDRRLGDWRSKRR